MLIFLTRLILNHSYTGMPYLWTSSKKATERRVHSDPRFKGTQHHGREGRKDGFVASAVRKQKEVNTTTQCCPSVYVFSFMGMHT